MRGKGLGSQAYRGVEGTEWRKAVKAEARKGGDFQRRPVGDGQQQRHRGLCTRQPEQLWI